MRKILVALVVTGLAYCSANGQTKQINACGVKQDHVCRASKDKKSVSCYKTQYAENFKVCKGEYGYFICCETPSVNNSTHFRFVANTPVKHEVETFEYTVPVAREMPVDMTVPQNQSYVNTSYSTSGSNTSGNSGKKACYVGNSVAESNRAPYKGCPSQQSDGPDANKQRNLNVSSPAGMPPLAGQPME